MSDPFEQLIKANSGRIRSIARRYADHSETDDLAQEILMALWRSFRSFRGESSVETWVYRIGFNTAMTRVRKSVKERSGIEAIKAIRPVSASMSDGYSQADILERFLASLNDIDASVMMMYLDGFSTEAMKEVLGISANALNVRVSRIKEKFSATFVDER